MNFIITTDCNKGCPYCFAAQHRKEHQHQYMDLDLIKKFLDKTERKHIKLLGGEPTLHPQFQEILEELKKREKTVTLISNFLFNDDVKDVIIDYAHNVDMTFLINSTNLDQHDRIKQFSKNYNEIYRYLYKYDKEENLSCGYTLENDKDWQYYVQYTDFLSQHLLKIERLRLSLPFPGNRDEKNNFYFINNTDLGEKFLILVKKILNIGAIPSLDCIIFPCMFNNKEEFKYIKKFLGKTKFICESPTGPADLFPNENLIYCYPLKDVIKINTKKYNTLEEAGDELGMRYALIEQQILPPPECTQCKFYKRICNGPCLGFYDLTEFKDLGNNL